MEPDIENENQSELVLNAPFIDAGGTSVLDLLDAMAGTLPSLGEAPPPDLGGEVIDYLRILTREFVPPPPQLLDRFCEYLDSQVQFPIEGLPSFSEALGILRDGFFKVLTPEDFEPLDPEGVQEGGVLFNSGGVGAFFNSILELLKLLKKLAEKAKEFDAPDFDRTKDVFLKRGPFRILALGEHVFFRNFKYNDLVTKTDPKSLMLRSFSKSHDVPKNTIAVTVELAGFSIISGKDRPVPVSGKLGDKFFTVTTDHVGPISVNVWAEYSLLKGKQAEFNAVVCPHYASSAGDDDWICMRVEIATKYYTLDLS